MPHSWKKGLLIGDVCCKCGMVRKTLCFDHPTLEGYASRKSGTPKCTGEWPKNWNASLAKPLADGGSVFRVAFFNPSAAKGASSRGSFPAALSRDEAIACAQRMNRAHPSVIHWAEPYPQHLLSAKKAA